MFEGSLRDVASNGNEAGVLLSALTQSIHDHGGFTVHLNKLLADLKKGDRAFFDEIAKKLVGKVWELVETPIEIGPIDFDCAPEEFVHQYPHLWRPRPFQWSDGNMEEYWSETRPASPCRYKLSHFPVKAAHAEIVADTKTYSIEHAGWREMTAYTAHLAQHLPDFEHVEIVCFGSLMPPKRFEHFTMYAFPAIGISYSRFELTARELDSVGKLKLPLNCFYLTRVPV